MRYMVMHYETEAMEEGVKPTPEQQAEIGRYMQEASLSGVLLSGEGVGPSSQGARVEVSDGDVRVIDGPFAEAKEVVAGFSIIKVSSLKEAIERVKRVPNVFPNGEAEVEIRKLMDVEDFGDGFTPNPEIQKVKFK